MYYPLMENNIERQDIDVLIDFLNTADRFTNGPKVAEFEKEWLSWLGGMTYSVCVNSGSSANYITMAAIREMYGEGEVIVSPIGWESDIAAIIRAGLKPVFVDVKLENMTMDVDEVQKKINSNTKAILLTHVLGFNGLSEKLIRLADENNIKLVEDACESHGTITKDRNGNSVKSGTVGFASNFSFYFAHHMSTIEGGMICTEDEEFYEYCRLFRSHGMVREARNESFKNRWRDNWPGVNEEFLFAVPGYNFRTTELNAVIGLNQLKRLDENIIKRRANFELFINNLDSDKYYTDFLMEGQSNYAFVIILRQKDEDLYRRLIDSLRMHDIEFRRGTAGGGNQTRQPYVQKYVPGTNPTDYPVSEHIHEYGLYVGNYPQLDEKRILDLCKVLNCL